MTIKNVLIKESKRFIFYYLTFRPRLDLKIKYTKNTNPNAVIITRRISAIFAL